MAERAAIDATVEGKTLVDVFNRNARDYADKAAIHWKEGDIWRHLTWSQYRRSVHEAAAGLISLGVSGGDFVAIMAGNRPEHVIGDLAAVHAGATGVTIYSTLAQSQIQYVAANCGAKVAILEDLSFMKRWEAIKSELPALTHVILMEGAENYNMVDWVLSWDDLMERGRAALAADPGPGRAGGRRRQARGSGHPHLYLGDHRGSQRGHGHPSQRDVDRRVRSPGNPSSDNPQDGVVSALGPHRRADVDPLPGRRISPARSGTAPTSAWSSSM